MEELHDFLGPFVHVYLYICLFIYLYIYIYIYIYINGAADTALYYRKKECIYVTRSIYSLATLFMLSNMMFQLPSGYLPGASGASL